MKRNQLIYSFLIILGGGICLSHSSGPGAVQDKDRTGGPVSEGTCANCHSGGSFGSSVDIAVTTESGDTVTAYLPETAYTLRIKVVGEGAAAFGFQTVALDSSNADAGMFGAAPTGTQITPVAERNYFEHSERSTSGEWEIEWTSPAAGSGAVEFYVAGNSVNNADGFQGDEVTTDSLILEQEVLSSSRDLVAFNLTVGPNPATNFIRANWDNRTVAASHVRVVNLQGQQVYNQILNPQDSEIAIDLLDYPTGFYVMQLISAEGSQSKTFLRQ